MNVIKTMLALILINIFFILNTFAQDEEIQKLKNHREILSNQVDALRDSINSIDERINFIVSSKIETGEKVIAEIYTLNEARIRSKPSFLAGNIIAVIPKYKKIKVFDFQDEYWLIQRDSIKGYVHTDLIGKNNTMISLENEYTLKVLSEKYDETTARKIMNKRIWIGMTSEMARESLGKPEKINKSTGSYGKHEQWIYKNNRYLYFQDGKLTSWQN